MAVASALGARSLVLSREHGQRPLQVRQDSPIIGRQLGVGANDPDQRLVILDTAAIGCKSSDQRQTFFGAQIDLLHILEEFEVSKHDGLHTTERGLKRRALRSEV